jgi:integrase
MAIELQLLTGARPTEVRLARWREIKGDRWILPAERSKVDRPFEIHLSKQARAVLNRARELPGKAKGDDFILANNGEPLSTMAVARALARIADRVIEAGGIKLRPHDLRRTTRTMMARLGIAPHIAERCLGHLDANILARVYDGHDHRPEMIEAWDRVGAHLASLRAGGAEVVALRA